MYFKLFKDLPSHRVKGWRTVERLSEAKRGDIIAWALTASTVSRWLRESGGTVEKRRFYCGMERESTQGKILQRKPRSLALTRLSDHGF